MMSSKGMDILKELYSKVREDYLTEYPGSNENDIERNFLFSIMRANKYLQGYSNEVLRIRINKIR